MPYLVSQVEVTRSAIIGLFEPLAELGEAQVPDLQAARHLLECLHQHTRLPSTNAPHYEECMQDHSFSFEVDATPQEIWTLFWGHRQRVVQHGDVRIEYLHWGDQVGEGRIRHCQFRVPRYLLSGGIGRSWEWLTEVKPHESWRYDAIGKPLWSRATGWTRLEDLGHGRTRVHFRETYEAFNPLLRVLFERRVHHFISRDNDRIMQAAIEKGVGMMRARRGLASGSPE